MTSLTPEQSAANTMAAAAHLFTGKPGQVDALNRNVAIIVGAPANFDNLLGWTDWVRQSGQPLVHISFPDPSIPVPRIAVICIIDGQGHVFESCSLWQPADGSGAYLVTADPCWGSFRIGSNMRMQHRTRRPFANSRNENAGYVRAYTRLLAIMKEQIDAGLHLDTLQRLELRAH